MNIDERNEYIFHRIETAYKTLEAAKLLSDNGYYNSAINRLYYAVFYAVNALLVRSEVYAQSHSGVKSQFSLLFIKSGKLDKKFGKLLAQLYDWRQKGDYENLYDFSAESVTSLFQPVHEMISAIENELIHSQ
ncbi:MAG: HEPN domain-containing protein [Bacteroidetes bacterium]|nr:HEPN domain-containing protein [Bacteroidota bacterium]